MASAAIYLFPGRDLKLANVTSYKSDFDGQGRLAAIDLAGPSSL
jgi:hypothetical protein